MDDMKRKNGYGSVYRLKGRRSRPYIAIITENCYYDPEYKCYNQKRLPIGYYRTRDEAVVALFLHNQKENDEKSGDSVPAHTFRDIYSAWKQIHFRTISDSMIRTWESAYRFFEPIHSKKFADIRPIDLEVCITAPDLHSTTRLRMKGLCNQLYKYAIKAGLTEVNPVPLLDRVKQDPPVYPHKPFTEEELGILWENRRLPYVDMILIACYTGLRPTELVTLTRRELSLSDKELHCGIKTNAGKNRCVPLLPELFPLFSRYIRDLPDRKEDRAMLSGERDRVTPSRDDRTGEHNRALPAEGGLTGERDRIFLSEDGRPMDYPSYRYRFKKVMEQLGMKHRPHDTRHTFITLAKEDGMDEYVLKLIVGHVIADLTEKVYTHRTAEQLHAEMKKLRIRKCNA